MISPADATLRPVVVAFGSATAAGTGAACWCGVHVLWMGERAVGRAGGWRAGRGGAAGADGEQGGEPAGARHRLGRAGHPRRRHAPRHWRHPDHVVPDAAAVRSGRRDHATAPRLRGRREGRRNVRRSRRARPCRSREHGLFRLRPRHPLPPLRRGTSGAPAGGLRGAVRLRAAPERRHVRWERHRRAAGVSAARGAGVAGLRAAGGGRRLGTARGEAAPGHPLRGGSGARAALPIGDGRRRVRGGPGGAPAAGRPRPPAGGRGGSGGRGGRRGGRRGGAADKPCRQGQLRRRHRLGGRPSGRHLPI
ncbi:unnamed protein product [Phaeothamnion confervicola]